MGPPPNHLKIEEGKFNQTPPKYTISACCVDSLPALLLRYRVLDRAILCCVDSLPALLIRHRVLDRVILCCVDLSGLFLNVVLIRCQPCCCAIVFWTA